MKEQKKIRTSRRRNNFNCTYYNHNRFTYSSGG